MLTYEHMIKDPVHGYIGITRVEKCIIDTGAFQRLRRTLQLPTSVYVYPGAVHTRFAHSIGAMHIASAFGENIAQRLGLVGRDEGSRLVQFLRLTLLLHDIGHGPFSHSFEETILYPMGVNHEIVGSRIIESNNDIVSCIEENKDLGFTPKDLSRALLAVGSEDWPVLGYSGVDQEMEKSLFYVLKGPFAADLLDYLIRDSYYTGAGYGSGIDWERIARSSIPLHRRLGILDKAVDAYEHVLIARFHMFATVYYHKTTRAVEQLVSRLLEESKTYIDYGEMVNNPSKYIELDDTYILGNPSIRELESCKMLLNRKIPYTVVEEKRLQIPRRNPLMMIALDRGFLNKLLLEKLGNSYNGVVYIDTPRLPLNPMLREDEVLVISGDRRMIKGFEEMSFGTLSHSVAIVRLYMDKRHLDKREQAVKAFREIIETSSMETLRSFY
ncbi:MAG TPA: HD domain-containing protein [Sulfolobales archaeon]|nr:HD domain-containing protein [Sulfolobales archaeon]